MRRLQILIPKRMEGKRLDVAISEMLPELSRSKITSWIKSGQALISKKTFKPKDKASGNEIISLIMDQHENNSWISENIPIDIVYEDAVSYTHLTLPTKA